LDFLCAKKLMLSSLRWRLTVWYVVAAFVVVAVLAVVALLAAVRGLDANSQAVIASASRDAPSVVWNFSSRHHKRLRDAAPDIIRYYHNSDLFVVLLDKNRRPIELGMDTVWRDRIKPPQIAIIADRPHHPFFAGFGVTKTSMKYDGPLFVGGLLHVRGAMIAVPEGFIIMNTDPIPLARYLQGYVVRLSTIAVLIMLAAIVLAYHVSGLALRPLLQTTSALRRFANRDFATPPVLTTDRSELGELAKAYNAAVEQVKAAFAERKNTENEMRQFIADAGHELRTPAHCPCWIRACAVHRLRSRQYGPATNLQDDARRE